MTFQEYVHAREHAPMGCGPQNTCDICKSNGFSGEVAQPLITKQEFSKMIVMSALGAIIGGLVTELVVRRMIFKNGR